MLLLFCFCLESTAVVTVAAYVTDLRALLCWILGAGLPGSVAGLPARCVFKFPVKQS